MVNTKRISAIDAMIPDAEEMAKQAEKKGFDYNASFNAAMNKLCFDAGIRVLSASDMKDIDKIYGGV